MTHTYQGLFVSGLLVVRPYVRTIPSYEISVTPFLDVNGVLVYGPFLTNGGGLLQTCGEFNIVTICRGLDNFFKVFGHVFVTLFNYHGRDLYHIKV